MGYGMEMSGRRMQSESLANPLCSLLFRELYMSIYTLNLTVLDQKITKVTHCCSNSSSLASTPAHCALVGAIAELMSRSVKSLDPSVSLIFPLPFSHHYPLSFNGLQLRALPHNSGSISLPSAKNSESNSFIPPYHLVASSSIGPPSPTIIVPFLTLVSLIEKVKNKIESGKSGKSEVNAQHSHKEPTTLF